MPETTKHMIDTWLRDAHATEAQAVTMLRGTAGRTAGYPMFAERLLAQAETCDSNARSIDACLTLRKSSTSMVKDAAGQVTALGQSVSGAVLGDEVMKAALATSTFARMQTTSARILVAAATHEGDTETARSCSKLLEAHEAFCSDLDAMMPKLTAEFLTRETDNDDPTQQNSTSNTQQGANQHSQQNHSASPS